jgi:hypothetical protein
MDFLVVVVHSGLVEVAEREQLPVFLEIAHESVDVHPRTAAGSDNAIGFHVCSCEEGCFFIWKRHFYKK